MTLITPCYIVSFLKHGKILKIPFPQTITPHLVIAAILVAVITVGE